MKPLDTRNRKAKERTMCKLLSVVENGEDHMKDFHVTYRFDRETCAKAGRPYSLPGKRQQSSALPISSSFFVIFGARAPLVNQIMTDIHRLRSFKRI